MQLLLGVYGCTPVCQMAGQNGELTRPKYLHVQTKGKI